MLTVTLPWPARVLHPNARPHWRVKAKAAKAARATSYALALQAGALAQFEAQNGAAIAWCWDWPDGARVPRVNPATGAVTGGVQ